MPNLPAETLLGYVIGDFEASWNAVANLRTASSRGNFMFALQTMILLELACRSSSDASLRQFGIDLKARDCRYFTRLPGSAASPAGFKLPGNGTDPENRLLYALFDTIRNGQAHQYQPTVVTLDGGHGFQARVTGADFGTALDDATASRARSEHLLVGTDRDQNIWIDVRTDLLFLDISTVVKRLDLPTRAVQRLEAPAPGKHHYDYSAADLLKALREGGHTVVPLTDAQVVPSLAPQIYSDAFTNPKPRG